MTAEPARRPRVTTARELELLEATVHVLRETGYEALTMDAVAARGRCSKATLYRMWGTKPKLVAAALRATQAIQFDGIDTGTLTGDLLTVCERLIVHAEKETLLFAALMHVALLDPELATAIRETLFKPNDEQLHGIVERAVVRGELAAVPPSTDFLPALIVGGLLLRPIHAGSYADAAFARRFVTDGLLPVLGHQDLP
ncbi:TetR/AcrR family transcriptional regulator [Nocardia sp. NPDC052112]|uniref:TetR/AcrR family transcriptional regulator n=1 Tax=Nocardia sp. NPDC052112 TaxID=3155646 RepID=UPI00343710DE